MENKKVVVALGRNAFSESFPKQQERVKAAAKAIADLVEEKYEVIITHSNIQDLILTEQLLLCQFVVQ